MYNQHQNHNQHHNQEQELQTILLQYLIGLLMFILATICICIFAGMLLEIANHISRIAHNEGICQGSLLLMSVVLSNVLSVATVYSLFSGILISAMTAAAFTNPVTYAGICVLMAAWVITPVFNCLIRAMVYELFEDELIDSRFRELTTYEQSLHHDHDINQIHAKTIKVYHDMPLAQRRSKFTLFDVNTPEMVVALQEVRTMRQANPR
jgi:magnesium-transporting ATPase (P-type)